MTPDVRIWKYPIDMNSALTEHMVPGGGEVLFVNHVDATSEAAVWIKVNIKNVRVKRIFKFIGTGHEVPPNGTYWGSFIIGIFVWHVFEIYGGENSD